MGTENPLRILFVEDMPSDATLAERVIRKSGLEFSSQRVDTKDAMMKALKEFHPDVIVSDYSMPDFDGMRALNLSLEHDSTIPFILLTGSVNEETAVACIKAGAWDYVIKEHMTRLPIAVKEALKQKGIRIAKNEAERARRESEEKFRRVVETALEGVWFLDSEFKTTEVNDALVRMLGYSSEELIGRPYIDFLLDEDRTAQAKEFQRRKSGVSGQYERRILSKGGDAKWLFFSAKAVMNTAGAFVGSFAMVTDITERKREERLTETLYEISKAIYSTGNVDELFRHIHGILSNILQTNNFFIALLTDDGEALTFPYEVDEKDTGVSPPIKVEDSQSLTVEVLKTKRPLLLDERDLLDRYATGRNKVWGTAPKCWLGVPLVIRDTVIGVMAVQDYNRSGVYSQKDVTLFESAAGQIAVAIDRKRAEEKIALLAHTVTSITECVSITDLDDRFLFVNAAFLKTYGYEKHEILGKSIRIVGSPNNSSEIVQSISAATMEGGWQGELLNRTKDGREFPVSLSTSFVRDDLGQPIALVGVATDITDRKRAEEEVKKSEVKFRAIFDNASDGMFLVDLKDRKFFESNAACARMLGYAQKEFSSLGIADIHPVEDLPFISEQIGKFSRGEEGIGSDIRFKRKDGSIFVTDLSPALLTIDDKRVLLIMFKDITERKRAEEKIKVLSEAIDSAYDSFVLVDMNGNVTYANGSAIKTFGYSPEETMKLNIAQFCPNPEIPAMIVEEMKATGFWNGELICVRKNKDTFPVMLSTSFLIDDKGHPVGMMGVFRDITERKKAEESIRESEERFRMVFENVSDGVSIYSEDADPLKRRLVECNERYAAMAGRSREELLKLGFTRALQSPPVGKSTINSNWSNESKAVLHGSFSWIRPDGKENHIEYAGVLVMWKGKTHTIGIDHDITERRRAEDKLQESEEKYRGIFENVQDVYYESAIDGTILEVSPSIEILSKGQYHREDLVGKSMYDFYTDPGERQALLSKMRAGGRVSDFEIGLTNRDGSQVPCSISAMIRFDDQGQPGKIIGSLRDVTERRKAEESRQLLTTAIESSAKGVVITDLEGRIVWVNKALTAMTGYSRTEVLGQNPKFLKSGKQEDWYYKDLWETISAGNVWTGELINKRKDGSLYTEEMSITPVRTQNNKVTHFVALKQDITDRKSAELNLRLSEERFRSVWDNSADGMRLTDREGRIIDVNAAFCKLVRKSREDLLGKIFSVAYQSRGSDDDLSEYYRRFTAGETIFDLFGMATLWNGESISLHISSSYIETTGQEKLLLSLFRDVTEQKKAEDRLEAERTLLRTLIDAIPDEIGVKDLERRFLTVNAGTVKAFKLARPEEMIGKRDEDFVPEHLASIAREEEDTLLAEGGKAINRVGQKIDPVTGEILRSILISKIPLKDSAGKTIGLVGVNRDITEVQRANASLEKERTLLLTLIESIPDEICLKDTAHRFVVANNAVVRSIGARSMEDLLGKTDFDFMSPELAQVHFEEEDVILKSGKPEINRERIRRNPVTGELEKCLLTTKVPVKDKPGDTIGILVINRYITERKRAEEELKSSEERLRILFEYAPDAYYLMNIKGLFVDGNKAAEELSGFAREELIGKSFSVLGLMKQEGIQKASVLLGKNAQGIPSGPDEFTLYRKDGSQVEVEIRTYPVTINNEVQVLGIARDVSQRKISEEALRASEEKFRALFEESKDAVYFSTVDGRLLDINPAGIELLGYGSKGDLLQIDLTRDGYADAKEKKRFDRQMEADGFVRDFEVTLKRKDGRKLTVLETAVGVRDKNGKIVQYRGNMRDVTRQRQLEAQFLQAQKMESIGTLAGGIAHDFNNILGIILGHVALMERSRENDTQFEESSFSINKAVERGASLVRQILTFARKAETQLEPVNINSMIKELAKMLDETFPKTIEIKQKLDKTIPIISMDPTQLHQTLLNLCVNARDAMNGEGTLAITTHLVLGRDVSSRFPKATAHDYVQVSVKDTGTGMDEETRQHIFEPFFTTKEKGKGTGLGLAVVYGVLQAHNGFIDVESALGAGTTFHLFFPVPEGLLTTIEKKSGPKEDLPRGSETILVVEDEDVLRDLLVKMLEMQGYNVIPACDGDEAVMRFSEHAGEIDLVLSDMGLPKRSGWDAFRMMQKLKSKVRLLLASGYIEPSQKLEILKSGAVKFIHKPYKMEEILTAIRETLD